MAVSTALIGPVAEQGRQPGDGLGRIEDDLDLVLRRKFDHLIDAGKECLVGRGQVVMVPIGPAGKVARKGTNAVISAGVVPAGHIRAGSEQIDPIRVEPVGLPVGEEHLGILRADVRGQGLGGIAGDKIGSVVLVHQVERPLCSGFSG